MKHHFAKLITFVFLITAISYLSFPTSSVKAADPVVRLAIISDSTSDEYRANDNRAGGTPYAATTLAWSELLAAHRNVNLGTWGTRSEPRRIGFEYNWARSGAQTPDMISSGQHTGVASQTQAGLIDVVYIQIGNNDFAYYNQGADIYNGTLMGTALQNKIDGAASKITTAVQTVLAANSTTKIVLGTIGDMGVTAYYQQQFPDPVKRQRVTDAINQTNSKIQALAATNSRITFFDSSGLSVELYSYLDANGNMVILGEKISMVTFGNEPHNGMLGDHIHGGTVLEGKHANFIIRHINQALGTTAIVPFSDAEILQNAGISIANFTPSPSIDNCPTDINGDLVTDLSDYSILVSNFLKVPFNPRADINKDSKVDLMDYSLLVSKFLKSCP